MGLSTTRVTVENSYAPPLGSVYDPLPKSVLAPLEVLGSVYPDDVIIAAHPGFRQVSDTPVSDNDCYDGAARAWTAVSDGTVTRGRDDEILDGLWTWDCNGNVKDGLRANLAAAVTDYTIAALIKLNNTPDDDMIFSIGANNSVRLGLLVNAVNDAIEIQHGITSRVWPASGAGSGLVADTWYTVFVNYNNTSKATSLYLNNYNTPVATGTHTNSPPATLAAAIMGSAHDTNGMDGTVAALRMWSRNITDIVKRQTVMSALNEIKAL